MEETIFSYIDSILFTKRKLNNLHEGETQFDFYMVNRWCSMYSPDVAKIINETANTYKQIFALKQEQYDFCFNMYPKVKKKKINYIKKQKEQKVQIDKIDDIKSMANCLEISQRETKELIDLYHIIFK